MTDLKEATEARLPQPAWLCSNFYPRNPCSVFSEKTWAAKTKYATIIGYWQEILPARRKKNSNWRGFVFTNGVLLESVVVCRSRRSSLPGHRCWEWPGRVSDNYEKTTAQCGKLDRFVARLRRSFPWSRHPSRIHIAGGEVGGETQRTVVSGRCFSSEPQPANGWSLRLHHQTIKVLYSTDHQEGRSVDCCRVAGFLCSAPATIPHRCWKRSSWFTKRIRFFRYRGVRDFADARFTVFGRTYFRDRPTPRATNENTNEAGAFQCTGWSRLRNVFAQ